jgi:ABC-type antimicrobial peptide transport system permease subunit
MVLVGIGVAIGTIGALAAARLIEGFLFEISAGDPATVAGAAGFFFVVALAACMLPAWRALKVDPMEALRIE